MTGQVWSDLWDTAAIVMTLHLATLGLAWDLQRTHVDIVTATLPLATRGKLQKELHTYFLSWWHPVDFGGLFLKKAQSLIPGFAAHMDWPLAFQKLCALGGHSAMMVIKTWSN